MEQDGRTVLRAESADEEALLSGGMNLGWELLLRTKDTVIIREGYPSSPDESGQDGVHKFELLEELPFTSSRQRMTILVRDTWNNKICLYSKGADSKMLSLSCDDEEMVQYGLENWLIRLVLITPIHCAGPRLWRRRSKRTRTKWSWSAADYSRKSLVSLRWAGERGMGDE